MKLCRTCWRLAGPDALRCPHCMRSFGGALCTKGHLTPGHRDIRCCGVCGDSTLTTPTGALHLSLVTRFFAWGIALTTLHFLFANIEGVQTALQSFASWLLSFVFGPRVLLSARRWAGLLTELAISIFIIRFILGKEADRFLPWKPFVVAVALICKSGAFLLRRLWTCVEGKPPNKKEKPR